MQLFDDEAVCAGTGTADVLAQRQAGDDSPRGQSGQLVGQSLCGLVGERLVGHAQRIVLFRIVVFNAQ